ncbi:MAG: hypothetical protein ACSHW0_11415 [Thalassotalea sp.]
MNITKAITFIALTTLTTQACASDSVQHSGKAVKHSTLAAGHSVVTTAKVASVAVAIPLVVVGSAGIASVAAADSLDKKMHRHTPIEITEITITADPAPNKVMITTTTTVEKK